MDTRLWWFVTRSSGMVAAVLLALTLVWGLLLSTRLIRRRGLPAWLADLHRYLGGLTVAFLGVHLTSLLLDDHVHFSFVDLFVPFASAWRAGPVAWGVGAFWLLVVVEGSSLLTRKLPRTTWRRLHLLSYPVALMTAVHAATAGTDAANPAFRWTSIVLVATLTFLTLVRILLRGEDSIRLRTRVRSGCRHRCGDGTGGVTAPVA